MKFLDTVTIAPHSTKDGYQDSTYGTAVTTKCIFHELYEKSSPGDNAILSVWIALPPGTAITTDSLVTLPDGSQPSVMTIQHVKNMRTNNVVYISVDLGYRTTRVV